MMKSSFPTPDISHLRRPEFNEVYPPAEDTFLLLDALEAERDQILNIKGSEDDLLTVFEMGAGSGVVSAFMAKIIGANKGGNYIG